MDSTKTAPARTAATSLKGCGIRDLTKKDVWPILDTTVRALALIGVFFHYFFTVSALFGLKLLFFMNAGIELDDIKPEAPELILALIPSYIFLLSIFRPYRISKDTIIGSSFSYILGVTTPFHVYHMYGKFEEMFGNWSYILGIASFFIAYYFIDRFCKRVGEAVNYQFSGFILLLIAIGFTVMSILSSDIILWLELA